MPPSLALVLCTLLVLFLLSVEARGTRGVSWAMWIPTLWMLIAASRPLATWFVAQGRAIGDNEAGSPLDRWVLAGLGAAAILVLMRRRFDWWGNLRRHKWLVALLTYMFVSTLWSEITLIAMKRWIRELIVLLMMLVIVSELNPRRSLASLLRRCAYVLIPFSVLLIKYYPILGCQYGRYSGIQMWVGVTSQKNGLGRLCMVSIFFLLWTFYKRHREHMTADARYQTWGDLFVIAIAFYLMKGSDSATSMATLALGIIIFFGLQWARKFKLRVPRIGLVAAVILLAAYGISVPLLGGSDVAGFTSMLGRDTTLTGRTEVWAAVLPAVAKQPLFGYGFGSFWTDARRVFYDIPTAHNGYLDILLELGAVGLAFFVAWLLSCARLLHRALALDYDWASFGICLLLMSLVYNATESALNSLAEYMTAVVVLTSVAVASKLGSKASQMLPVRLTLNVESAQLEGEVITHSVKTQSWWM
jgi:exopolysaccharide production protein ExoQ